jgi:hypothetical protein
LAFPNGLFAKNQGGYGTWQIEDCLAVFRVNTVSLHKDLSEKKNGS